jgi:hypothetical protein
MSWFGTCTQKKSTPGPGMVAHIYTSSYLGGRDRRIKA